MLLNIGSLAGKAVIVNEMITDKSFDELCLTETWLKPNDYIGLNESTPPSYCYKHEPRQTGRGGNKMAPSMAAVLRAPTKLCSFSCVVLIILLFFILDVYTLIAYDRHTLLEIGSSVAHRKPDFEFLNAGALFTNTASEPFFVVSETEEMPPENREESWRPRQTDTQCLSTNHFAC